MPVDSVNTIDDLRSYVGSADLLIVKGYWSIGDGGGGIFCLDNGSSEPDDAPIKDSSTGYSPRIRGIRIFHVCKGELDRGGNTWQDALGNTKLPSGTLVCKIGRKITK